MWGCRTFSQMDSRCCTTGHRRQRQTATSYCGTPLSGGEPVELIKGSAPQFVPPDRLLFTRGSTLLSVRLDMAARRVTGDAEVVTDQMLAGGSDQVPHFTASRTGDLYYLDGGLLGTEASTLVRARPGAEPVGLLDDSRDFVDRPVLAGSPQTGPPSRRSGR